MMRLLIFFTIVIANLFAVQPSELYGEWEIERQSTKDRQNTVEYSNIIINPASFVMTTFVTIQKDNYLIKDLQLQKKGIWKVSNSVLVFVVSEVHTVNVAKTINISQESINQLSRNLQKKYMGDPIHIINIQSISGGKIVILNQSGQISQFNKK